MHFVYNEVRDLKVSVDDPVHLEVVVVLAERIDQGFGNLLQFKSFLNCWSLYIIVISDTNDFCYNIMGKWTKRKLNV